MALMSSSFSYFLRSLTTFSASTPFCRSPMAPLTSTMPTRAPEPSRSVEKELDFTAEYASSMNPNNTRNRPPKMTASTTAARLSNARLLPRRTALATTRSLWVQANRALPAHAQHTYRAGAWRAGRGLLRLRRRVRRAGGERPGAQRLRPQGLRRDARGGLAEPAEQLQRSRRRRHRRDATRLRRRDAALPLAARRVLRRAAARPRDPERRLGLRAGTRGRRDGRAALITVLRISPARPDPADRRPAPRRLCLRAERPPRPTSPARPPRGLRNPAGAERAGPGRLTRAGTRAPPPARPCR